MPILQQPAAFRPEGFGGVGENACAKGAVGRSRLDGPQTGSADIPTVSRNWTAGGRRNAGSRRRNANGNTGQTPRHGKSMPRQNANGVRSRGRTLSQPPRLPRRARGHAVTSCRNFFVTGRAATNRRVPVRTRAIAARPAPPSWSRPMIVNVSACGATVRRADSNVLWNTRRPAPNVA